MVQFDANVKRFGNQGLRGKRGGRTGMADFLRLSRNWIAWTNLAGMKGVSISGGIDGEEIDFVSDDQSCRLRKYGDSWVVDTVDEHGQTHENLAVASNFELAEKYLVWRWSSMARSAVGAISLGARLHSLGLAPNVEVSPTDQEGAVELRISDETAIVPRAIATIFSHLMPKTIVELEQLVRDGAFQ